jgi:hypothetical protein
MFFNVIFVIALLGIHFLADFPLQSRKIANNKGKDIRYLLLHGIDYTSVWLFAITIPLFIESLLSMKLNILGNTSIWYRYYIYCLLNGVLHIMVDFVTSKFTSKFYARKEYSKFFTIIGLDQFIHTSILFITYNLILI